LPNEKGDISGVPHKSKTQGWAIDLNVDSRNQMKSTKSVIALDETQNLETKKMRRRLSENQPVHDAKAAKRSKIHITDT
jgi:ribosomal protein L14E/L6E/L27E